MTPPRRVSLFAGVGLLLVAWASRLMGLEAFPVFLDETIHIRTAELVTQTSPFYDNSIGRLFTIWYLVPFQPFSAAPIWIARAALLMTMLPGLAALWSLARQIAGLRAALLVGGLYLFSAYHYFFERMALADSISGSAVLAAIWVAYRLSWRVRWRDALLVGGLLFVAVGLKTSVLQYLGIPLAAAVALYPRGRGWRRQGRWLLVALAAELVPLGALVLLMRWRGYNFLNRSFELAAGSSGSVLDMLRPERLLPGAQTMLERLAVYLGPLMLAVVLLALVYELLRRRYYLLLCLVGPLVVTWGAGPQESRYWIVPVALLLLSAALLAAELSRRHRLLVWGVGAGMALWALSVGLPFMGAALRDPVTLPVPPEDYGQYFASDAAGFGLAEVRAHLAAQKPVSVTGALSNCQGLRFIAWDVFSVNCPLIRPDGQDKEAVRQQMEASRQPGYYVVLENSPYVPETAPGALLAVVERPGGLTRLSIYDLAP